VARVATARAMCRKYASQEGRSAVRTTSPFPPDSPSVARTLAVADAPVETLEALPRIAGGRLWQRILVRCHVVEPGEDLFALADRYLRPLVRRGDIAVLGQKLVSISQGRLLPLDQVRPRPLARLLSRTVRRSPHGLGLRRPQTMEMAIREVGVARILWASLFGLWDHLTGQKGHFYRVVGSRVSSIDGPGPETLPPYDRYVVLAPDQPQQVCRRLARRLGCAVALVDANDLAVQVLGASPGVRPELVARLLEDNPMGQGAQRTPLVVLRPGAPGGESAALASPPTPSAAPRADP
jgi:hypothetical protein